MHLTRGVAVTLALLAAGTTSIATAASDHGTGDAGAAPAARVLHGSEGSEVIRGGLHLRASTVHELRGDLLVEDGDLVIDPGTRIEAAPGTAIVVGRQGRIIADGTTTRPIVMTCLAPAAAGCWQGLVVQGLARVNDGPATSPAVPGRDAVGGCRQVLTGSGSYGGCADDDSSGVLRNVWIQNAGSPAGAALALEAVGSRTVVEHVHVFRAAGTGVALSGGTVDLRYVRVVTADSVAMGWDRGWRGHAQYGIVQARAHARAALEGANLASNHQATPRSAPWLRNFTIIGPPSADTASGAVSVHLQAGTAARLETFVVSNRPAEGNWLLDIDDVATWDLYESGEVRFESSYIVGLASLGALDDDPLDPVTTQLFSPDQEGQSLRLPAAHNRIVPTFDSLAIQLKAPYGPLQDLRPRDPGPLATTACSSVLTPDPFFDDIPYCGALTNSSVTTLIPWDAPGPVEPLDSVPSPVSYGYLYTWVVSNEIGPIAGARIRFSNVTAVTDEAGFARQYLHTGFTAYTLENLPPGCADPGLFFVNVPPGGSLGQTALVQCNP